MTCARCQDARYGTSNLRAENFSKYGMPSKAHQWILYEAAAAMDLPLLARRVSTSLQRRGKVTKAQLHHRGETPRLALSTVFRPIDEARSTSC